jgi:hypothetical protein
MVGMCNEANTRAALFSHEYIPIDFFLSQIAYMTLIIIILTIIKHSPIKAWRPPPADAFATLRIPWKPSPDISAGTCDGIAALSFWWVCPGLSTARALISCNKHVKRMNAKRHMHMTSWQADKTIHT